MFRFDEASRNRSFFLNLGTLMGWNSVGFSVLLVPDRQRVARVSRVILV
jgi:hypothetical protein